ncbi:hypothetical protein ABZP36_002361 [Zizania latifolia]
MDRYDEKQQQQLFASSYVDASLLAATGAVQAERQRARRRRRRGARRKRKRVSNQHLSDAPSMAPARTPGMQQVLRLKERLVVAEEEVRLLRSAGSLAPISGEGGDIVGGRGVLVCGGSPSSSFSTGTCQPPGVGGSGGADHLGDDDLMYVPEYGYADNSVFEWFSLHGLI